MPAQIARVSVRQLKDLLRARPIRFTNRVCVRCFKPSPRKQVCKACRKLDLDDGLSEEMKACRISARQPEPAMEARDPIPDGDGAREEPDLPPADVTPRFQRKFPESVLLRPTKRRPVSPPVEECSARPWHSTGQPGPQAIRRAPRRLEF